MVLRQTYSSRRRARPYPSPRNTSSPSPAKGKDPESHASPSRHASERVPFRSLENQKPRSFKSKARPDKKGKGPAKETGSLQQLFFDVQNPLRSCRSCGLSYTAGLPDDELIHKQHCSRVAKGLEWSREEEKDGTRASLRLIDEFVPLKGSKERGRVIAMDCVSGGKIGSKITAILDMINLCLSAPSLTAVAQKKSRIYLFLLPPSIGSSKERIVGAIVLTRIEEAMRLAKPDAKPEGSNLVLIDSGLYCYPERVPAAMGVSRIFVSTTYRRLGIAAALLRWSAKTFIHGCPMRFEDGGIAFSQPTESGRGFMEAIGEGYIGIYEE